MNKTESKDYRIEASAMVKAGLIPIPLKVGSKQPAIRWKEYQDRFPTVDEIESNFKECGGISALTLAGSDPDNLTSDLFLLDFDLKYQRKDQDVFNEFLKQVPKNLRDKLYINASSSGIGRHIWFRVKGFWDKSRKLCIRTNTIPELLEKYNKIYDEGRTSVEETSKLVLKNPFECIIESRGSNSYGVIVHESHRHISGNKIQHVTKEEAEFLIEVAVGFSEFFIKKESYTGTAKDFNYIDKFNAEVTPSEVLGWLTGTGMFEYVDTDRDGNILIRREGTNTANSGKIFADKSITFVFTNNTILGDAGGYNAFQVYTICRGITQHQAMLEIKKRYTEGK